MFSTSIYVFHSPGALSNSDTIEYNKITYIVIEGLVCALSFRIFSHLEMNEKSAEKNVTHNWRSI